MVYSKDRFRLREALKAVLIGYKSIVCTCSLDSPDQTASRRFVDRDHRHAESRCVVFYEGLISDTASRFPFEGGLRIFMNSSGSRTDGLSFSKSVFLFSSGSMIRQLGRMQERLCALVPTYLPKKSGVFAWKR